MLTMTTIDLPCIFVYPTRRCNYRCSYCFTESGIEQASESFLTRNWGRLIDEVRQNDIKEIRLSGGEPLLIAGIKELCEAVVQRGMSYTLTSNGSRLNSHLSWMSRLPPTCLWLSYHREHVSSETFLRIAGKACSSGVRVGVNLFERDAIAADGLLRNLASCGVTRFKIINTSPIGRGVGAREVHVSQRVLEHRISLALEDSCHRIEVRVALPLAAPSEVGPNTCVIKRRSLLSIDYDGSVYPCCSTLGHASAKVGDLSVEPLRAVITRVVGGDDKLACREILPRVSNGEEGCPLALVAATCAAPV